MAAVTPPTAPRPSSMRPFLGPDEVAVGIDIGGTKSLAVAYGSEGALAETREKTRTGLDGMIEGARLAIETLNRAPELQGRTIGSLGIGLPGLVNPDDGTVSHGVNIGLPRGDVPFARLMREATGIPTFIGNDVNMAAVGAAHALDCDDAALLWIGTGLACGFILNGRPRFGAKFGVGEIGHLTYRHDGPPCSCGQRGCLELYASGQALTRIDRERRLLGPAQTVAGESTIWDDAKAGNPAAAAGIREWAEAVSQAVHIIGLTVDSKAVIIGGGVSNVGAPMLHAVREAVSDRATKAAFLGRLDLAHRLHLMPTSVDAPTLGAAVIAAQGLLLEM